MSDGVAEALSGAWACLMLHYILDTWHELRISILHGAGPLMISHRISCVAVMQTFLSHALAAAALNRAQ
jgi:hypothetical protein